MTNDRQAAVNAVVAENARGALEAGWAIHVDPIVGPGVLCIAVRDGELFSFFVAQGNDLMTELETLAWSLRDLAQTPKQED